MDYKDHIAGVGSIVTNLQGLASVLRRFLVERYGQCSKFRKMGDTTACRSCLTAFESLGPLIKEYHGLEEPEKQFSVDETVVPIRDALAHGRLITRGDTSILVTPDGCRVPLWLQFLQTSGVYKRSKRTDLRRRCISRIN
jgi:hypothetical protein